MIMIITDALRQTRIREMFEHKWLVLAAIPGPHLLKQPLHLLQCEFERQKHHQYGYSMRKKAAEQHWLYSQLGTTDSPRGLTRIEEHIHL